MDRYFFSDYLLHAVERIIEIKIDFVLEGA
jgi:hypothetical protein